MDLKFILIHIIKNNSPYIIYTNMVHFQCMHSPYTVEEKKKSCLWTRHKLENIISEYVRYLFVWYI